MLFDGFLLFFDDLLLLGFQKLAVTDFGDDEAELIQDDQRQGNDHMGDDIRRGDESRDDHQSQIGILAVFRHQHRCDDTKSGQKQHQYRQLEDQAEGQGNLEQELEVLIDADGFLYIHIVGDIQHKSDYVRKQDQIGKRDPA